MRPGKRQRQEPRALARLGARYCWLVAGLLFLLAVVWPAGPALADFLYLPPPAPPDAIPELPCETPADRAAFKQLKEDWAINHVQFPAADNTYQLAGEILQAADKATLATHDAWAAAISALDALKAQHASADAIAKATEAKDQAGKAYSKARDAADHAAYDREDAENQLKRILDGVRASSDGWSKLIGAIGKRKCAAPQPQTTPQPQPPPKPPPPNTTPATANNRPQPLPEEPPAPKAKCAACKKLTDDISQIDAKITALERNDASLRQNANPKDPNIQKALSEDGKKISDLKAQKSALEDKLLKCEQSCAPKAATDGEVANTTGSVLQGNVLSGDVLQGIGVTPAPANQPNRSGDESESGQSDKTGEHGSPGQPPGRSGPSSH